MINNVREDKLQEYLLIVLEQCVRVVFAGICGGIIGYERKNRGKGAGIRTHIIVSMASALMMVISKYGFNDMSFGGDFRLDPSRVASQIVSGVGFLGAGMIFVQKKTVHGLTTAAGVWATSGIGMAVGCGMYILGLFCSLLILLIQVITHKRWKIFHYQYEEQIFFSLSDDSEALEYLKKYITDLNITITKIKVNTNGDTNVDVELTVILPDGFNALNLFDFERKYIISMDV